MFTFTSGTKQYENKKELMEDIKQIGEWGWGDTIYEKWKEAQDEAYSAPVYNYEEDYMELKVWSRGYFPLKEFIEEIFE
jgi:hypothetical protein